MQADRSEYSALIGQPGERPLPDRTGCALIRDRLDLIRFQAALYEPGENDQEMEMNRQAEAGKMSKAWDGPGAAKIPVLPDHVALDEMVQLTAAGKKIAIGYQSGSCAPAYLDPAKTTAAAVMGGTGCGKTTLISLLERLWETEKPDMIRIDGHPLRTIPLAVLHRDLACVPQDSFLFSDTIENNIAFGVQSASAADITEAARAADVHDNIMEFPDQYQTMLGERGVTVSGGQKQRISIARALMKNAPVLILDDALSAVDTDTEERILTRLKALRKDKTTLIIAHRISTIQHADHILVLEDGKAAEYGSHEELMALGGLYRSLWEKQQLEAQLAEEQPDPEGGAGA